MVLRGHEIGFGEGLQLKRIPRHGQNAIAPSENDRVGRRG